MAISIYQRIEFPNLLHDYAASSRVLFPDTLLHLSRYSSPEKAFGIFSLSRFALRLHIVQSRLIARFFRLTIASVTLRIARLLSVNPGEWPRATTLQMFHAKKWNFDTADNPLVIDFFKKYQFVNYGIFPSTSIIFPSPT